MAGGGGTAERSTATSSPTFAAPDVAVWSCTGKRPPSASLLRRGRRAPRRDLTETRRIVAGGDFGLELKGLEDVLEEWKAHDSCPSGVSLGEYDRRAVLRVEEGLTLLGGHEGEEVWVVVKDHS